MTDLPRTTATGLGYLARFAAGTVYVFRDPAKPGSGVSRPALDRLVRDGLVRVGDCQALRGKPLIVTDLGHAVLAARTTQEQQ